MGGMFLDPPTSGNPLAPIHEKIAGAKVVCSTVPEIAGNRDIGRIGAPRELADVDFAIVRAAFAVAETGSVLLDDTHLLVNAVAYLASSTCITPTTVRNSGTATTHASIPVRQRPQISKVF
jgi:L-lactate dehydrogenase complex protein LldG